MLVVESFLSNKQRLSKKGLFPSGMAALWRTSLHCQPLLQIFKDKQKD